MGTALDSEYHSSQRSVLRKEKTKKTTAGAVGANPETTRTNDEPADGVAEGAKDKNRKKASERTSAASTCVSEMIPVADAYAKIGEEHVVDSDQENHSRVSYKDVLMRKNSKLMRKKSING